MKNLLGASELELLNQHINLDKVTSLTADISKGVRTAFDKQIELSLIMHNGYEWFKSPEAKQVMKALDIEMSTEEFHTKAFGFKKSFFYDMVKVGGIRANETEIVSKYKKECNKIEKDGESSGRSVKGLLAFAKQVEAAEDEAEEGEEAEAVEVEAKAKALMTFAIKGDLTMDGKGASIRLMDNGEIKVSGSSSEIHDSVHTMFESASKELISMESDAVPIEEVVAKVNKEYKAEKKAKAEKIEVYVLEDDEFEQSITHRDQCNADLGDYVNERLERGEIDEENAAELRMGA